MEGWVGVDGGGETVPDIGPATEKVRLPNCVLLRLKAAARVVVSWRSEVGVHSTLFCVFFYVNFCRSSE